MEIRDLLYEGKAKKVYKTDSPDHYVVHYKDDATAFDGKKKGTIADKGLVNNQFSNFFFKIIEKEGIPTHFIEELGPRKTLVHAVTIFQIEVIIRNVVAGSMSRKIGVPEGTELSHPTFEISYKSDEYGDPLISEDYATALGWITREELDEVKGYAIRINDILRSHLLKGNMKLIDFKIEFGKKNDGTIVLADEISPDTCRLWDVETNRKMDKDRFRRDLGEVEETYQEAFKRILGI
jgi:phosphoribosylaminoimidazole-succinocarboxamide synthase